MINLQEKLAASEVACAEMKAALVLAISQMENDRWLITGELSPCRCREGGGHCGTCVRREALRACRDAIKTDFSHSFLDAAKKARETIYWSQWLLTECKEFSELVASVRYGDPELIIERNKEAIAVLDVVLGNRSDEEIVLE